MRAHDSGGSLDVDTYNYLSSMITSTTTLFIISILLAITYAIYWGNPPASNHQPPTERSTYIMRDIS